MADFIEEEDDPQDGPVTPTMADVIMAGVRSGNENLKVGGPGTVIRYDKNKQLADVQPDLKRRYKDGTVEDAPIIYNVPVKHLRAGRAIVHVPVKKGHKVWISYADKSIDKWLSSGKATDPDDTRSHHISDAVCYPGCYSFNDSAKIANNDDLIIQNEDLEIRIKPNGKIQILNKGEELIKILHQWITADLDGDQGSMWDARRRLRTFLVK